MPELKGWLETGGLLARGTWSLWRKTWLRVCAIYTVTWAVSQFLWLAAAWVATRTPTVVYDWDAAEMVQAETWTQWAAVVVVALSFLVILVGTIIALRVLGNAVGDENGIPRAEERGSLTRTLSLTLLAFLGIYSCLDYLTDAASTVYVDAMLITGDVWSTNVFGPLNPSTFTDLWIVLAVIGGAFAARRLIDWLGQRTGKLWLGFLAAWLEAFYLLAAFEVGIDAVGKIVGWLRVRAVASWFADFVDFITFGVHVPELLAEAWDWFAVVAWPVISHAVLRPIFWLALAALVLGTQIKSFGELLEAGQLSQALAGRTRLSHQLESLERDQRKRSVVVQLQDALFSDLDEKYLPIYQILKLTLRSSIAVLGAYLVAFNLIQVTEKWVEYGLGALFIDHSVNQIVFVFSYLQPVVTVFFAVLRFALLAAAYCLMFGGGDRPEAAASTQSATSEAEVAA
ncbi:MAG: hypothetical protein LBR58_05870 [Propionibacteriaceae bacterium]|nr:hypothetical protein [Propionibacteriaceae bacterium]